QHGIPVALNAGDLLIGEGYRLIGECQVSDAQKTEMLLAASIGQRELCRGQGAELLWARNPVPLKSKQVLEIFRQKTAPAFEVALKLGASYAGKLAEVAEVLSTFSENLGIAYQIRDDMDDLGADAGDNALDQMRPSVLLAVARERAKGEDKALLESLWSHEDLKGIALHKIRQLAHDLEADEKCLLLLETYKDAAVRSLADLDNPNLKGLLRRVMGKIFNDLEIKGWCREFEVKNGVREEAEEAPAELAEA
ncbi:MAG: polyprenyl synthetase family protein, partial [Verrucomicrobiae bacterium]|nr:polyprenyl synthetase family protein [Verrucomicrobiae bacterium]